MQWLRNFMHGRYGIDAFGIAIISFYLIFTIINLFFHSIILNFLSLSTLIYFYFRALSKSIYKRSQENMRFLRYYDPICFKISNWRQQLYERKYYKYYTCKKCKQKLRVPKGKGKITITCPKCKLKFDKCT